MRSFLVKIFKFLMLLPVLWLLVIVLVLPFYERLPEVHNGDDAVFIWGDSQLYRGLNLSLMSELTNLDIQSAARHGAGTYDFLIFAQAVPASSTVVISVSKTAQLRRKSKDRNMSGISIDAMVRLYDLGYSPSDLLRIVIKNPKPKMIFEKTNKLYAVGEPSFTKTDSLLFESVYASIPNFAEVKQSAYIQGIKILLAKDCRILFLDYPYHSMLRAIEKKSPVKKVTDSFSTDLIELVDFERFDTLTLPNRDFLMHDYTHLDQAGADLVTEKVAEVLSVTSEEHVYIQID
ncbi:MAG: hypothetical protein AAF616_14985 [Bacteroidota bacterium]